MRREYKTRVRKTINACDYRVRYPLWYLRWITSLSTRRPFQLARQTLFVDVSSECQPLLVQSFRCARNNLELKSALYLRAKKL